MTHLTTAIALALTLAGASTALAQDADDLRSHCAELEAMQTPGVVDCYQAAADADAAASDEDAQSIVRDYYETASPYDFQRTVTTAGEAGATMFDAD